MTKKHEIDEVTGVETTGHEWDGIKELNKPLPTLEDYAGVKPDLLPFVCDAAAAKQGKFMPGSHIAIVPPAAFHNHRLEHLLVLPWNIEDEIKRAVSPSLEKGTRFVTAIPTLRVS